MIRSLMGATALVLVLSACGRSDPNLNQIGPQPEIPPLAESLVPPMKIAQPTGWGDQIPTVPAGFTITALATDFQIPRQMLVLPNGDILVAEGRGGHAPPLRSQQAIGYAELHAHLDGRLDLSQAIELMKRNSRRYARRQLSWYRGQAGVEWIASIDEVDLAALAAYLQGPLP